MTAEGEINRRLDTQCPNEELRDDVMGLQPVIEPLATAVVLSICLCSRKFRAINKGDRAFLA